eukprot:3218900-Alexandrium_andersonii.AAC.1
MLLLLTPAGTRWSGCAMLPAAQLACQCAHSAAPGDPSLSMPDLNHFRGPRHEGPTRTSEHFPSTSLSWEINLT